MPGRSFQFMELSTAIRFCLYHRVPQGHEDLAAEVSFTAIFHCLFLGFVAEIEQRLSIVSVREISDPAQWPTFNNPETELGFRCSAHSENYLSFRTTARTTLQIAGLRTHIVQVQEPFFCPKARTVCQCLRVNLTDPVNPFRAIFCSSSSMAMSLEGS